MNRSYLIYITVLYAATMHGAASSTQQLRLVNHPIRLLRDLATEVVTKSHMPSDTVESWLPGIPGGDLVVASMLPSIRASVLLPLSPEELQELQALGITDQMLAQQIDKRIKDLLKHNYYFIARAYHLATPESNPVKHLCKSLALIMYFESTDAGFSINESLTHNPYTLLHGISSNTIDLSLRFINNLNGLERFRTIRKLCLAHNKLGRAAFERLGSITECCLSLDLTDNNLEAIPDEVFQLTKLQELTLTDNLITVLPPTITALSRLKILRLQTNKLTSLPLDTITQCKQCPQFIIDARDNPLSKEYKAEVLHRSTQSQHSISRKTVRHIIGTTRIYHSHDTQTTP